MIKSCASYFIVMQMRAGRTPQQACEDALQLILDKYKKVNPDFVPGEKFVAINKAGDYGCSGMGRRNAPRMTIMNKDGMKEHTGSLVKK